MTTYLRFGDPDFQFRSAMIRILLLPEGKIIEKHCCRFIMLPCFCHDLKLISLLFDILIA